MLAILFPRTHATDATFPFNLDPGIMLTEVHKDPGFVNLFFCFVFPRLFLNVARPKVYVHFADLFNSKSCFIRQEK